MKTKAEIIASAKAIFDRKANQQLEIAYYDDLRVVYPVFINYLNQRVVRVEATYHNHFSEMDGERVHLTVPV